MKTLRVKSVTTYSAARTVVIRHPVIVWQPRDERCRLASLTASLGQEDRGRHVDGTARCLLCGLLDAVDLALVDDNTGTGRDLSCGLRRLAGGRQGSIRCDR